MSIQTHQRIKKKKGFFTKSSVGTKSLFWVSASDIAAKVSLFGILISIEMDSYPILNR